MTKAALFRAGLNSNTICLRRRFSTVFEVPVISARQIAIGCRDVSAQPICGGLGIERVDMRMWGVGICISINDTQGFVGLWWRRNSLRRQ